MKMIMKERLNKANLKAARLCSCLYRVSKYIIGSRIKRKIRESMCGKKECMFSLQENYMRNHDEGDVPDKDEIGTAEAYL